MQFSLFSMMGEVGIQYKKSSVSKPERASFLMCHYIATEGISLRR